MIFFRFRFDKTHTHIYYIYNSIQIQKVAVCVYFFRSNTPYQMLSA